MMTSGHTFPTPFATVHYMNRFLNPAKCVEMKYTNMADPNMSLKEFDKLYKLPDKKKINLVGELRPMLKKDLSAVYKLWTK